jgi:hypothetical protein
MDHAENTIPLLLFMGHYLAMAVDHLLICGHCLALGVHATILLELFG